ncbi:rhamnosyltransferase [Iodidimonas nitroreducens]|uniref:Rhamnosyltransferase n=2 Tax=Iodidimonas nitroreducens TaxID=1236968 RepID=A0A5A7N555_9PROT|nr:rhamnosyltransferase [Iodidimonas nitroreducens]
MFNSAMTNAPTQTLGAMAAQVLGCDDAILKARKSREAASLWQAGALVASFPKALPARPGRPQKPQLLPPGEMPRRRKAGSLATRIALLHAVAHIELNAIDLAWDLIARFGADMPRDFLDDWVGVADDEARHFMLISDRLIAYGSAYGELPAHDGLWEAAINTADCFEARLAVVPLVLEARGLDVTPSMIARFQSMGDSESVEALSTIYHDEIGHVAAGARWFHWHCERLGLDPEKSFQSLVTRYFRGALKPPFNVEARSKAGLAESFYQPLAPQTAEKP